MANKIFVSKDFVVDSKRAPNGASNAFGRTVRWTVPDASANTGGYNNFLQSRKCKSIPVSGKPPASMRTGGLPFTEEK